jgi:superfamily II DNA helicase RecQ
MKDQVDALRRRGIKAVAMDSSKSRTEFLQMNEDLRGGKIRLLYCAPERLNNEGFVASLKHVRGGVRLLAVDEAHCISEV